jgi:hypothetical protein
LGEVFDLERVMVVGADPGDGFGGAVALFAEGGNGAEAGAFFTAEDAVDEFLLKERGKNGNVGRSVEQMKEPAAGVEKFRCGGGYGHAGVG